jgi:RNA polymerase sigma factor (sigma-70 family)
MTLDRQRLATENTKLAFWCVMKMVPYNTGQRSDLSEWEGEALIALTKAALHYNPTHSASFSTYAVTAIRRRLWTAIQRHNKRRALEVNLTAQEGAEGEGASLDQLGAPNADAERIDANDQLADLLRRAKLTVRQRQVLYLHYYKDETPTTIAKRWRLSVERVRQIRAEALHQLRLVAAT